MRSRERLGGARLTLWRIPVFYCQKDLPYRVMALPLEWSYGLPTVVQHFPFVASEEQAHLA